ncbi:MAG: tetratricopeptide repeat protein, partial [Luteimonas sp.]
AAEATLSLRGNDLAAARATLEGLLRDPTPDAWRYAFGALGGGARDPKAAAILVGQLLDAGVIPNELQTWLAFGGLVQRLGQGDLAERIVGEVIARFPGEPRVALLRASQLREAGKPDEARAALVSIENSLQLVPELRLAIAAEYDGLGDSAAAEAVLARGPQDDQTWRLRAGLLARAENKAGLATLYGALKQASVQPDPARRLLLGQTAEFLERNDEALAWYASVPGGPQRAQARLRSAKLMHDTKRSDIAYRDLRQLQSDASVDDEARIGGYLLEAELRNDDDDAAGELDVYARGLAAYPDAGELLYARGLMWERRDDIARAEADLRRILVAEPDNIGALNALGYTLADRTTRYAEALELIDRARVAEPDSAAIIDSYGWVLYRLGRNADALVELRRAFALQKDAEIAAHLGEVLWVSGNKDEARKYFDEARKLDPDSRTLQRALAKTGA